MPLFRSRSREDEPQYVYPQVPPGDPAPNLAQLAQPRTHKLTGELLDWLIASLEAVLSTPEVREYASRRATASLVDALKQADRFYPLTLENYDRSHDRRWYDSQPKGKGLALDGDLARVGNDPAHDQNG